MSTFVEWKEPKKEGESKGVREGLKSLSADFWEIKEEILVFF